MMKDYIGKLVKRFESGSKGSLALSSCGNDWGLSCGSYQLTLRWGNCISFLKKYFPIESTDLYFNNLKDFASKTYPGEEYCSNPEEVKAVWTACYNKVGEEEFFEYEHEYIKSCYYDPICEKLKDIVDIDTLDRGFRECFWSWSVHKGSGGAEKAFREILKERNLTSLDGVNKMELFDDIYDYRYNVNNFNRFKKGINPANSERETLRPYITEGCFGDGNKKEEVTVKPLKGYLKVIYGGEDGVNVRRKPDFDVVPAYAYMKGTHVPVTGITSDEKFYVLDDGMFIVNNKEYVLFE